MGTMRTTYAIDPYFAFIDPHLCAQVGPNFTHHSEKRQPFWMLHHATLSPPPRLAIWTPFSGMLWLSMVTGNLLVILVSILLDL